MEVSKVYGFSNENLTAYQNLFGFNHKWVLSVLGSGDQYFTAMLNGASKVDVYDTNLFTWFYFVLKFYAIRHLSYDEFYQFFVTDNLDNLEIYKKIRDLLPNDVRSFFDYLLTIGRSFSSIKKSTKIFLPPKMDDGKFIPYFDRLNYARLQNILNGVDLPEFFNIPLFEVDKSKRYDLLLASNIFHYLGINASIYKNELLKFKCPTFQAHYSWIMTRVEEECFLKNGFEISYVDAVLPNRNYPKDKVITLKR